MADDNTGRCEHRSPPTPDAGVHEPAVQKPGHYQSDTGLECIDAIRAALGRDGFRAFCQGNALKYVWRAGSKPVVDDTSANAYEQDMKKASVYAKWAATGEPDR